MPGIAGIVALRPVGNEKRLLRTMIESMRHETFYVSGVHIDEPAGLYAGYVCHRGSFADCQPVHDPLGRRTLLLGGECFVGEAVLDRMRRLGRAAS
jgi:hypothetical protein